MSVAPVGEQCATTAVAPTSDAQYDHMMAHGQSSEADDTPAPTSHSHAGMGVCMLSLSCSPAVISMASLETAERIPAARAAAVDPRSPATLAPAPETPPPRA
jgi:hypothetical protein